MSNENMCGHGDTSQDVTTLSSKVLLWRSNNVYVSSELGNTIRRVRQSGVERGGEEFSRKRELYHTSFQLQLKICFP